MLRLAPDELDRPRAARGPLMVLYTVLALAGFLAFPFLCWVFLTLS